MAVDLAALLAGVEGFDWDAGNSAKSLDRHGVTRAEAEQAFSNRPVIVLDDPSHSDRERRLGLNGVTNDGRSLAISFTIRGARIRVISARAMSRKERRAYEEAIKQGP